LLNEIRINSSADFARQREQSPSKFHWYRQHNLKRGRSAKIKNKFRDEGYRVITSVRIQSTDMKYGGYAPTFRSNLSSPPPPHRWRLMVTFQKAIILQLTASEPQT